MSLLDRFLGGGRSKAYAEGVTCLEEGRYAEAVESLRVAALGKSDTPSGSLASFHFRQALLREGRRLLRTERKADAIPLFAEAAKLWDVYPDLHCLLGAARGLSGEWEPALAEARTALRLNPDYAEARLLEAVALQALGRARDAAASLNGLLETGRRVDHWLISGLAEKGPFTAASLPDDLTELLERSLSGESEKEEVAAAVALCRAGEWEAGLERFAALVQRRPRYPDYRTRHAAALFQMGRRSEALGEVDAALALNESYRMAIDLKGLILADSGRLQEALDFLGEADRKLERAKPANTHEAMFASYLRGVLSLLTGRTAEVVEQLGAWPDLLRNFARAELLLAAAEQLNGQAGACGRRLNALAEEWSAEPVYSHLLACHQLAARRFEACTETLGAWPGASADQPDQRPLYLAAVSALAQDRRPTIPAEACAPRSEPGGLAVPDAAAWIFLRARGEMLQGEAAACAMSCAELVEDGLSTERVLDLHIRATSALRDEGPDWQPTPVWPDACLPALVQLAISRGQSEQAAQLVARHRRVHPDDPVGYWLDAAFWLEPVRTWLA